MTAPTGWEVEKARRAALRDRPLTELNQATTARYEACLANGGHEMSEDWIERDGFALRLCGSCGVPIPRRGWGDPRASSRGGNAKKEKADAEWPRRRVGHSVRF